jgi:hypothetical protein
MPLTIHQARAEDFPALEQLLELYQNDSMGDPEIKVHMWLPISFLCTAASSIL